MTVDYFDLIAGGIACALAGAMLAMFGLAMSAARRQEKEESRG